MMAFECIGHVDKWSNDLNAVVRPQNGQGLEGKLAVNLQ